MPNMKTVLCCGSGPTALRRLGSHTLLPKLIRYSHCQPDSSNRQYVVNLVRKHDYETFLSILLLPATVRNDAFAINAYNVELSLILEQARQSRALTGRIAFWNDALNSIYAEKKPFDHPVVTSLNHSYHMTLSSSPLSRKWLNQMLQARHSISNKTHLETIEQLEDYAEHTRSSTLYLMLASGGSSDINTDHAASHLGRSLGLVNTLRSTPYLSTKNQLLLPQEVLIKHKVSQQDVLRGRENVKEAVYELASLAHQHLTTSRSLVAKVPKSFRNYFLPSSIAEHRLELLRLCDFNVFDHRFLAKDTMLPWRLWRKKLKLRFS